MTNKINLDTISSKGGDVNAKVENDITLLMSASKKGDLQRAKMCSRSPQCFNVSM